MTSEGELAWVNEILQPIVMDGRRHLTSELSRAGLVRSDVLDAQVLVNAACDDLARFLHRLSLRAMLFEINAARVARAMSAQSAHERFVEYCSRTRWTAGGVSEHWPYLAEMHSGIVACWCEANVELAHRLIHDIQERVVHPDGRMESVVEITEGLGDAHRGARTVKALRFADGKRVVYKPRPVDTDVAYSRLVSWLNRYTNILELAAPCARPRAGYGWVDWVEYRGCTTEAEVCRFYERQGQLVCLLTVLNASDMHYENIVASGEQPIVVDLETLCQPLIENPRHVRPAVRLMANSVLRTGLLPRPWGGLHGDVDVSGIGSLSGQEIDNIDVIVDDNTDTVRMAIGKRSTGHGHHRPMLLGRSVSPTGYVEHVVRGCIRMQQVLVESLCELQSPSGPLEAFRGCATRVIPRATGRYRQVLDDLSHPFALTNGAVRADVLATLPKGRTSAWDNLSAVEQNDIKNGTIPYFHSTPSSDYLVGSDGNHLHGLIAECGMDVVRRRLQEGPNIEQNTWLIRAAFASLSDMRVFKHRPEGRSLPTGRSATVAALLNGATAIGRRLEATASKESGQADWLGLVVSGERSRVSPLPLDLYNGLPGVCLFLAYLGKRTSAKWATDLAKDCVRTILHECDLQRYPRAIGAFTGAAGLAYALVHLSSVLEDPRLLHKASALLLELSAHIDQDSHLDMVAGVAGFALVASRLSRWLPEFDWPSAAFRCAKRLKESAVDTGEHLAWRSRASDVPLAGLSHGASGIAWALMELNRACPGHECDAMAAKALAYERSIFMAHLGTWPDLRLPDRGAVTWAWCHGAPGIGLARVEIQAIQPSGAVRKDLDAAISDTLANGGIANHSLCHGLLGNAELLIRVYERTRNIKLLRRARVAGRAVLDDIASGGATCGTPVGVDTPGFMTGLAGIGYGLLRLALPEAVPSVLTLDPPREAEAGEASSEWRKPADDAHV